MCKCVRVRVRVRVCACVLHVLCVRVTENCGEKKPPRKKENENRKDLHTFLLFPVNTTEICIGPLPPSPESSSVIVTLREAKAGER